MKTFKAICAAAVLALSLSLPAYADPIPGDVHTPGYACPAPGDSGVESTDIFADNAELSFSEFAEILWAMASLY